MTAGRMHSDDLEVDWDGSRFTLHVPHDMTSWEARWLELNLPMSIRGHGEVEVAPASADRALPGRVAIGPITLPLRGGQVVAPGKLRAIVERAAHDAQAAAAQASEHAAAFGAELRRT